LRFGGRAGIRDLASVESAIARPYNGYYRPIAQKAAALVHSLALNHGFIDGNKRTAVYMMMLVLERSGYELKPRRGENLNDAVETMVTDVVEHKLGFADLVEWFKQRIMALPHE